MSKPLVSDERWEAVEPLLPRQRPSPKGGRPRVPDRAAMDALLEPLLTSLFKGIDTPGFPSSRSVIDRLAPAITSDTSARSVMETVDQIARELPLNDDREERGFRSFIRNRILGELLAHWPAEEVLQLFLERARGGDFGLEQIWLHGAGRTMASYFGFALEQEILRVGPERVAAFFCEPVIGAGGVHLPPEGYIDGVADLCAEHGVLLVIDSVICAFGRLGTWFGIERWPDVRPDMITFAKGVTSGYLPLGGVVASGAVAAPFFSEPGGPMLRHGATYAAHPACCAAALAIAAAMMRFM